MYLKQGHVGYINLVKHRNCYALNMKEQQWLHRDDIRNVELVKVCVYFAFLYWTNNLKIITTQCSFDAFPDPTLHFDADPDLDPTLSSHMLENQDFLFFIFIHSSLSLYCYIFLGSVILIGIIIFIILYSILKLSGKNYCLAHRLNMELDLQSLFGLLYTAVLIGWDPATPPLLPAFGLIYEGAKIDDISL